MILRQIKLTNFRSHESLRVDFDERMTKIVGRNGCGKTSILEAVYEVLQGKSFRAVDREILRRGAQYYRVELNFEDGRKVVVVFDGEKKEFLVEDKKTRRLPRDNKYPIVLFEPDDLNLVRSSPTSRRAYFDRMLGQLSENYTLALLRYNKALKQRNELLKNEGVELGDMFSWNLLLAKYGTELNEMRAEMVELVNEKITTTYRSIAETEDEVRLEYLSEVSGESDFLAKLERNFERDRILGHTSFGVHRDNYDFEFNQAKANGSASRGEVRSLVIALKFIEAEMIVEDLRKRPVVLLDDVFSELDEVRQGCLVKNFQDHQIILTSVEVKDKDSGCVVLDR